MRIGKSASTSAASSRARSPPNCQSCIRPALAPITAISIGIHNLHDELRYAGHELPWYLRSDPRRANDNDNDNDSCGGAEYRLV